MWKLFDEADGYTKADNSNRIKQELEKLPAKIKQIKSLEVGFNFNPVPAAFDIVLYSKFENWTDLKIYQDHPEHEKFKQFIQNLRSDQVVVDYEI